jgi:uncharacterized membrane protein YgcG
MLCLSPVVVAGAFDWPDDYYVIDDAGLLSPGQMEDLDSYARQISREYECGVYIITLVDFTHLGYGYDSYEATWQIYHNNLLGYGQGHDGIILMLSMAERDYALFCDGHAEYAFNSYGQIELENEFLDNLRNNDWYGGFSDYLKTADRYLALAAEGKPVRQSNLPKLGPAILIGVLISAVITAIFWAQMRNVHKKHTADNYVTGHGLRLRNRTDLFLRRTRSVRRIPRSSGSSGSSGGRSGGGGSGRSGKF